jgi:hypothetical protein
MAQTPNHRMAGRPGKANAITLEACATRAGFALGCAYSSSDEYEADVIRSRRAAGAYGVSYHREFAMIAATIAVLALLYLAH